MGVEAVELKYLAHIEEINSCDLHDLMTQYGDDVWRYAYALTGNYEQSKDIAQEVFIKVHHKIATFRGQSTFKTWLFSITRNLAINEMRSSYFRKILLLAHVHSNRTEQSAELAYMESQAERDIWQIIMGLSRKLREVLVLSLEHNLTIQEMAKLLEIPEGTVKSRLNRARKEVERKLGESER